MGRLLTCASFTAHLVLRALEFSCLFAILGVKSSRSVGHVSVLFPFFSFKNFRSANSESLGRECSCYFEHGLLTLFRDVITSGLYNIMFIMSRCTR